VRVQCVTGAENELLAALQRIDSRPRATRGWKTAREAYAALPSAEALLTRTRFLNAVDCAVNEAVQDCRSARQRRMAERRAILATMECFGLITRTRGRAPKGARKPEEV